MSPADIDRLLLLGLNPDEIWCAIVEPGPWTESQVMQPEAAA